MIIGRCWAGDVLPVLMCCACGLCAAREAGDRQRCGLAGLGCFGWSWFKTGRQI